MSAPETIKLKAQDQRFIVSLAQRGGPRLVFWGPRDAFVDTPRCDAETLPASPDIRTTDQLFPLLGEGFFGEPALLASGKKGDVFRLTLDAVEAADSRATLTYSDPFTEISLTLSFTLDKSGLLTARASVANCSDTPIHLQRMNALTLPLPRWANIVDLTYGAWSSEGHAARIPLVAGKIERTGRSGRPGFDGGPHLLLTEEGATEVSGCAIGLALAYSGNFTLAAERFGDGEAQAFAAEWLHPGEVILAPGENYQTPPALAGLSTCGLRGLSAQFHDYARKTTPKTCAHRPVQLNSWEAAYFSADEATAMRLADEAAAIGAERFVLDDGWFKNRNNDRAGLGDWTPDPETFPNGLKPLVDHVEALGLEFGLWVEPEMINEDSDLFQAHPDWILSVDGTPGPTARNQLVLDLSRGDVQEHLFSTLQQLLTETKISYLKWDCNRDLFPAAKLEGPAAHRQIQGLYQLLDRIREAFPMVSIESCASGGGRVDFGALRYADRFWASDATDALERIRIMRRASLFYPPDMLGAHVGSSPNHWTGRQWPMAFRCLVALFGHFGVELDPATLSADEKETLKRAIVLYKEYRALLTEGSLLRFDVDDKGVDAQAVMAPDHSSALLRVLRLEEPDRPTRAPLRLAGLPKGKRWRIRALAIEGVATQNPTGEFSSDALAFQGLDVNPPHTASGALYLMEAIT